MELSHFLYCALANLLESLVFVFVLRIGGGKNMYLQFQVCKDRNHPW